MKKTSFGTLIYYLKKENKLLLLFLGVRLAMTAIDVYSPLLIKNLIDDALPSKNIDLLLKFSIILIILYILRLFFAVNSQANGKLMGSKIKQSMRNDLLKKLLNQPSEFFKKNQSGDLISRVINDLDSVSTLCHRGLEDFIFSVITIIASIFIMIDFDLKLSLITLFPLPLTLIFVYKENKKMKAGHRSVRKNSGLLSANLHDILRTISFLKDNYLEGYAQKRFLEKNDTLLESEKKNMIPSSLIVSGVTFYSNITQLIIILAGGYLYIKDGVTMGIILSFLLLVDRFRLRIMRMVGLVDIYQKGISGVNRFTEIINLNNRMDGDIPLIEPITSIEFKNIGFSYDEKSILQNFNLKIEKGEKIALVGESGIGKSTTASLLKRALLPTNGEILINNIPLNKITFKTYLERLGIVDQSDYIINGSLIDNITLVKENCTEEELNFAIEKSYVYEIFDKFPQEENTIIGEGGVHVSSGQRQKIAMARLFLKNPDLILLDEATNALDIINEKSILKNIKEEYNDRIVIAITHRLSILEDFDKIYVLGDDNIVESGSFKELLKLEGKFYRLYHGIR
ncbi:MULTISPECIES: ABC transporter ATP-binding protein [Cetobacterium]|uniref:Phage tail component protein n=1 Tax=Cetobacterium somerae ATCC BAA-474 TaxID=1319815 RepID=U7VDQ2_9FUSO|nr:MULTISPECIES: ABC transporter ATP-binding protein [Cetobacterium]ERT69635.1 phage tail component protein [Cetobacterium somerae ATCC BAA-474]MBC2852686.1 ABC transporter ATP-binding protein [Cetobacterium sp. 2G large]